MVTGLKVEARRASLPVQENDNRMCASAPLSYVCLYCVCVCHYVCVSLCVCVCHYVCVCVCDYGCHCVWMWMCGLSVRVDWDGGGGAHYTLK